MVFSRLFRRDAGKDVAQLVYVGLVTQARHPDFYTHLQVPDSLDGRFDAVALHVFLVLNRLKREDGEAAAALAQNLVDAFVDDMDRSVRELGVGDMGVSRRVKLMAQSLYGRAAVYEEAVAQADDGHLTAALARNLYGTREATEAATLAATARYVRAAIAALAGQDIAALAEGRVAFPAPPVPA
ncbi:MAG: ubiquinol-cytochrome C chaperone [Proteobacteria bacterium]|nr:ubiquinol-cytochrome C chaperone [Pseudomonadota bacterium]